jgi:hypothetical protein
MKKHWMIIAIVIIISVVSGCATVENVDPIAPKALVVIGQDGIPQPDWVNATPSAQDVHYESGYGKMSDRQNSIKRATVEAKNKIAEWVSTKVKEVIVTYVNDAGSGANRQAIDAMETISLQVAEATLSGVTTDKMWIDAQGGVWVLCSIPLVNVEKNFEPAAEAVAEAFSTNDAADAANAKMKDTFARLLQTPAP